MSHALTTELWDRAEPRRRWQFFHSKGSSHHVPHILIALGSFPLPMAQGTNHGQFLDPTRKKGKRVCRQSNHTCWLYLHVFPCGDVHNSEQYSFLWPNLDRRLPCQVRGHCVGMDKRVPSCSSSSRRSSNHYRLEPSVNQTFFVEKKHNRFNANIIKHVAQDGTVDVSFVASWLRYGPRYSFPFFTYDVQRYLYPVVLFVRYISNFMAHHDHTKFNKSRPPFWKYGDAPETGVCAVIAATHPSSCWSMYTMYSRVLNYWYCTTPWSSLHSERLEPKQILLFDAGKDTRRRRPFSKPPRSFSQPAGACRPRYVLEVLVNWGPGINKNSPCLANQCCQ